MDNYDRMMLAHAVAGGTVLVLMGKGRRSYARLCVWQTDGGHPARRALVELPDGFRVNVRQACVMLPTEYQGPALIGHPIDLTISPEATV